MVANRQLGTTEVNGSKREMYFKHLASKTQSSNTGRMRIHVDQVALAESSEIHISSIWFCFLMVKRITGRVRNSPAPTHEDESLII